MRFLVGIGNYTMGDDGVGLRVAELVESRPADFLLPSDVRVVEIAGNGLDLLSCFEATTEKMVWVDCARFVGTPGSYSFFSADSVESKKYLAGRSTHEGDLLQVLELARKLGYAIPPIEIMGIVPGVIAPGAGLSSTVEERLAEYAREAIRRLLRSS